MEYKITEKVLNLVECLFSEGYSGVVEITKSYATGTKEHLSDSLSVQLSGFCKEQLYIVECVGEGYGNGCIMFVGRYNELGLAESPNVGTVVELAWNKYKIYKDRGYGLPTEFEKLFLKYGYLKKKTVEVYEEIQ